MPSAILGIQGRRGTYLLNEFLQFYIAITLMIIITALRSRLGGKLLFEQELRQ